MNIDFTISEETIVFHYGEKLSVAEVRKKITDNEQFQRWFANIQLEIISERLNKSAFDVDIEDFHWSCFCGVHYYDHIEWGLRDDDLHDQSDFHYDLQKLPAEILSELMKIWEKSDYYFHSVKDRERLKENVIEACTFLILCTQMGVYLPTLIKEVLLSVERGEE